MPAGKLPRLERHYKDNYTGELVAVDIFMIGRPDNHPFEIFLQLENIEYRTTQIRRPQSNGIVERLHRTLLDEHFRIQGRIKFYESLEEMQVDLDNYLYL